MNVSEFLKWNSSRFSPRDYQHSVLEFMQTATTGEGIFTLRLPRQSGKNELLAHILHLHLIRGIGDVIVFSPSYRQTRITYRRLKPKWTRVKEGHIFQGNYGNVFLVTAGVNAKIVGLTASAYIVIDEAQDVDEALFKERILPMTASTNAPILLMGTANSNPFNLLKLERDNTPANSFQLIASDINYPIYVRHLEGIIATHGREAPFIKTQYFLEDTTMNDVLWFDPNMIREMKATNKKQVGKVIHGIDLGGVTQTDKPKNDLTEIVTGYVRGRNIYLADRQSLRNKPWEEQMYRIKQLCGQSTIIDARGVGEYLATTLASKYPRVEAYKATQQSVSSDLYKLGALIKAGNLYCSTEFRNELIKQIVEASWEMKNNLVSVHKGSRGKIDLLKAVTYVVRGYQPKNRKRQRQGACPI